MLDSGSHSIGECRSPYAHAGPYPGAAKLALKLSPDESPGEFRQATILFSDLSGFTALAASIDPEDVEALMAGIQARAITIVERHGGTVNRFIGDEVMALFGIPIARRHDADHAVTAALELHSAVDELALTLRDRLGLLLKLHTGIDTGRIVTRQSDVRNGIYTVTGDSVNMAARLRSAASAGEILVSRATWQQVAESFECAGPNAIMVKGKNEALSVHRVLAARPGGNPSTRPIFGRDREIGEIDALARTCASSGKGQVVVVRGHAGVGKTRLVAEFLKHARSNGYACHSAVVLDFGAETGRDAVRALSRSLLGIEVAADEPHRRSAIERAAASPDIGSDQALPLYDLLDVEPKASERALLAAMSEASRDAASLRTLCSLVTHACKASPLFLLVDDIHWASTWTLDRLAAIAALASDHPLLLVMTTRVVGDPTASSPWRAVLHEWRLTRIRLGALRRKDARCLAANISCASVEARKLCVRRSAGNPLFLEQLLLDPDAIDETNIPGSIQALVHARMDHLEPDGKLALQAASVLGQRFSIHAVRQIAANTSLNLAPLIKHFLIRPDGDAFMFCHALIRDGVYASLLRSARTRLHVRAAEWFQPHDALLAAEHFDRGGDARAAKAYLTASHVAATQFRFGPALALLKRGHELAGERRDRFEIELASARMLIELGRSAEAVELCAKALQTCEGPAERAQTLIQQAAGMRLIDRIDEGLANLQEAQPLAEQAGLSLELSRLHHLRGNLLFPLGRADECLEGHEIALGHAIDARSLEDEAAALGGIGDAQYLRGHMATANEQFAKCVRLSQQHGFGRLEVANLPMVGWTRLYMNDMRGAVAIGVRAIELAIRVSQMRAELLARALVFWVDGLIRCRPDTLADQFDRSLALACTLGSRRFEAQMYGLSALIMLRSGQRELARSQVERGLGICREHGMGYIGPWILGVLASIESSAAARADAIAEGELLLESGCVSHNQILFRELAIEASIAAGEWERVEKICTGLELYTAQQSLPYSDFLVERGRALSRWASGQREAEVADSLKRLRAQAVTHELKFAIPALNAALSCR